MNPSDAIKTLKAMYTLRQPAMLHGSPGIGKSDVVRQVSKELEIDLIDFRLSQVDPVDLRGIPSVVDGKTQWNVPAAFPTEGKGILFLDEINLAPPSVQAAAYQLVLDRKLGDYELPEGWVVFAAGNRSTDQAAVIQMAAPLRNRLFHVDFTPDVDDWISWGVKANIDPLLLGFIKFSPHLLNQFDSSNKDVLASLKTKNAFATPRSWAMLSKALTVIGMDSLQSEVTYGYVGESAGAQFLAYAAQASQLPDIKKIMSGVFPPIPSELSVQYALTIALAFAAKEDKQIGHALEYISKFSFEMCMLLCSIKVTADPMAVSKPALAKFISANKGKFRL